MRTKRHLYSIYQQLDAYLESSKDFRLDKSCLSSCTNCGIVGSNA